MKDIEDNTCVRFSEGSNAENHYIYVTNNLDEESRSEIGYIHDEGQSLNFGTKTRSKGAIIHEFLHALGFDHQHSAVKRDDYVEIVKENIRGIYMSNLMSKAFAQRSTDFGCGYDYNSVMHYGPYEGSMNGKETIRALKPGAENMGQRVGLSPIDICKIRKLYNC